MKKILSLMLAILMLCGILVSCNTPSNVPSDTTADPTETPEDTTDDPTDTTDASVTTDPIDDTTNPPLIPENEIVLELVKSQKAQCKIIYDSDSEVTKTYANDLRVEFLTEMNVDFMVASDAEEAADSDTVEILIGATNRPESETASRLVGYNDYGVIVVGKKVIIMAHFADNIQTALDLFRETCFEKNTSTKSLKVSSNDNYASNKYYQNKNNRSILGRSYADYTIILPVDCGYTEYRFALRLQHFIGTKTGKVVDLGYDKITESDYEILIGKTDRTAGEISASKYSVTVKGNKVEMISDSYYGYDYLYNYCEKSLLSALNMATADSGVIVDENYVNLLIEDGNNSYAKKNGELRIMFHNVGGFNLFPTTPDQSCMPELRNPMIAEYYADYQTDVLCLEEITPSMRNADVTQIGEYLEEYGYAEVKPNETHTWATYKNIKTTTPIYYNTKTLELIDGGSKNYMKEISPTLGITIQWDKFMSWAVFKVKATGETFAVINVHYDSFDNVSGDGIGAVKAKAEIEFVLGVADDIIKEYNCPMLIGGDMNKTVNDPSHTQYLAADYTHVREIAKVTDDERGHFGIYPIYTSCVGGGYFTMSSDVNLTNVDYKNSVDHIYIDKDGKAKITFNIFDVIADASNGSFGDHCGMLIDFDFN